MKIVVTTPTGHIGRRIVRELLAPEFSVRVIVRDPARLTEDVRAQAEVIRGSTDDAQTLRRALDGMEALFFCIPAEAAQGSDAAGHYQRFARAAAKAILETRTPRLVTISASGNGLPRQAGPILALQAMEGILNESGAAIRHLRCGAFMENFLWQQQAIVERGVLSYPIPGHIAIPLVAAADVADVALRWLVRRDWSGVGLVAAHGPEILSCDQAAVILARVLERPMRYQEASANRFIQSLSSCGASRSRARSLVELFAELAQGISRAEPGMVESMTPTTLADWVRSELLPRVEQIPLQPDADWASPSDATGFEFPLRLKL